MKSESKKPGMRIKVNLNGSYTVTGGIPLSRQELVCDDEGLAYDYRELEKYPLQETYWLCRCGKSTTPPFCSGAHKNNRFEGSETAGDEAYLEQPEMIKGPELTLLDIQPICASARFCDRSGGAWDNTRASDNPSAREIAIGIAGNCPAGRLLILNKAGESLEPEFEPSIVVIEDPVTGVHGPIWVRGGIEIEAADGHFYKIRNRVTLCRCGHSNNKPFCDGQHVDH